VTDKLFYQQACIDVDYRLRFPFIFSFLLLQSVLKILKEEN